MSRSSVFLLATLSIAVLADSLPATAPAVEPTPPLQLTLRLDRSDYLEREPIFADWVLTSNRESVRVPADAARRILYFEYREGRGRWYPIGRAVTICGGQAPPTISLARGRSLSSWGDLRGDFKGFGGIGSFSLRAVCQTGLFAEGETDRYTPVTVRSNEVTFRVGAATGAEEAAVKLIHKLIPRVQLPEDDADTYRDPDEARLARLHRQQEYETELEQRRNSWPFRPGVSDAVLSKTKAPRFHVAARIYLGISWFGAEDDELRRKSTAHLRFVLTSKHSSHFVKGLASLQLLRWKLTEDGDKAKMEAKEMARKVLKDYANTAIADETQKLLDRHQAKK
jgi:hypothetical protein